MNKNIFIYVLLLTTFFSSCKKEEIPQVISANIPIESLEKLDAQSYDGKILLSSDEPIDGNNTSSAGDYYGVFFDANEQYVKAGIVSVNDSTTLPTVEDGKRNLLLGTSTTQALGKENKITFRSTNSDFKSFKDNIYFPKKLSVKTDMQSPDFLETAKNLTIKWTSDDQSPDRKIYLTICALGKPCKLIEIDDQLGTYTVNSSELNFLQQGDKVFITILRGNFKSIKVDQKNILLGAYLYSTTSVIVK